MTQIIGAIIAVLGICFGVYVGFWVMFVGGIVDIIDSIKAPITEASVVGFGVVKILFASFAAAIIIWISIAAGAIFGFSSVKFRYRRRR